MNYQQIWKGGLLASGIFLSCLPTAQASNSWQWKSDIQGLSGNYSGSSTRSSIRGEGVMIRGDYLDEGGFSLGVNATQLTFKNGTVLNQKGVYGRIDKRFYFDALPGALSLRLDGHALSNNDKTGSTNTVNVIAPQVSFLNYGKNFYMDLGLAYSTYPRALKVLQLTPTVGLGFNQAADWLQLRGYWVKPSNAALAQNTTQTLGLESKWTHWLAPSTWLPRSMTVGTWLGQRIYAVDGDAAAVYNLADVQQGSLSLTGEWSILQGVSAVVSVGNERYRNQLIRENYNNQYVYLDVKGAW